VSATEKTYLATPSVVEAGAAAGELRPGPTITWLPPEAAGSSWMISGDVRVPLNGNWMRAASASK
jgi:hypothetical protein